MSYLFIVGSFQILWLGIYSGGGSFGKFELILEDGAKQRAEEAAKQRTFALAEAMCIGKEAPHRPSKSKTPARGAIRRSSRSAPVGLGPSGLSCCRSLRVGCSGWPS